jgi:hypothetical protein
MSEDKTKPSLSETIVAKIENVHSIVKLIPGVIGTLFLILEDFKSKPIALFGGIALICLTILWFAFRRIIRERSAREPVVGLESLAKPSAYIRGLLPFEQRDNLLGRDEERKQINTIINSDDFTFGYLSGEAGCGKTSFIRSIIIEEVQKSDMFPVSVKTLNGHLIMAINQVVLRQIETSRTGAGLEENIQLLSIKVRKPIIVVIDQFEEFFIGIRSADERKLIIKQLATILRKDELSVKMLICLRKEFVDDLQEFYPEINQPTDRRFSLRLKNFDVSLAKIILSSIVQIDRLRFSDQLCSELINDLAREGYVRPVEFQIVTKSLLDSKIYDYKRYQSSGKANGILAAYIQEIIHPRDNSPSELDRQITRTILKLLCDDKNDTRRAIGSSRSELQNAVRSTIERSSQKDFIINAEDFRIRFDVSLGNLVKQYVVKYEDDNKINLLHDYLVSAIRLATADIETTQEQANRMLDKYLQEQKMDSKLTIPRKHYKFIRQHASESAKDDFVGVQILKRTRRAIQFYNVLFGTACLALVTALFPPRIEQSRTSLFVRSNTEWAHDRHRKIVIARTPDTLFVWANNKQFELLERLPNVLMTALSYEAKWLMVTDSVNTYILRNDSNTSFTKIITIRDAPLSRNIYNEGFYGFSKDETQFFLIGRSGGLYVLDLTTANGNPKPLIENFTKTSLPYFPPEFHISPGESFFYGRRHDMKGKHNSFFILPRKNLKPSNLTELDIPEISEFGHPNIPFSFSDNDSLISYIDKGRLYCLNLYKFMRDSLTLSEPILICDSIDDYVQPAFSPDSKWIFASSGVACAIHLGEKSVFLLDDYVATDAPLTGSLFFFSKEGRYCSFTDKYRNLYVVEIKNISNNNLPLKPILLTDDANFDFSFPMTHFSPESFALIATSTSGYVYYRMIDAAAPLKQIAYYGNADININWARDGRVYTFSNNKVHYGFPSDELKLVDVALATQIVDIFNSDDASKLFIVSKNELCFVRRELYLWNVIPIKVYVWPEIVRG